jgi:hypothetical protein
LCYVAPFVDLPATTVRHWLRRSREIYSECDQEEREHFKCYVKACKNLVEKLDDSPA